MEPTSSMIVATVLFALAVLHTFLVKQVARFGRRYPKGSIADHLFHYLSEVEVVFGLWAAILIFCLTFMTSGAEAVKYIDSRNFTEPLFVFVIMVVCATAPILALTRTVMESVNSGVLRVIRLAGVKTGRGISDLTLFVVIMTIGPLLGSLITEPAAMTVCALMLLQKFYQRTDSVRLKYAMTGLLFVNISIGGTLTSFAAPPVLMVAHGWGWDTMFMLGNFGWKAAIACLLSTLISAAIFRKDLMTLNPEKSTSAKVSSPWWLTVIHLSFVGLIILNGHHSKVFIGLFLFFLGVVSITEKYQEKLRLRDGLLVGFFLAGLVVLGGPQGWWIAPLLVKYEGAVLFLGSAGLTAITDNAAITYLGSLVPDLSDSSKYALVAGAVAGGGLTVIANAPNPAGYGILNPAFGKAGMSPWGLFKAAIVPTAIACACFWWL